MSDEQVQARPSEGRPDVPANLVRQLREATGAGMMDCKRALQEGGLDLEKATEILRIRGQARAETRSGRRASQGVVDAYIHGEGNLGVLVELNCETDFVARTDDFRRLAREIAMQVAASNPRWLSVEDIPEDVLDHERKIHAEKARAEGKPEKVLERIVEGQLQAFYKDTVLLEQPYIRETSKSVRELVTEVAAKTGENVVVRRFARFKLGEDV